MGTTIDHYLTSASNFAAPFLLDMLIKATVLVVAAYMASRLIRPASAAVRHRVWSTTFGCLLLLPVLSLLLPDLRLPIVPASETANPGATGAAPQLSPVATESVEAEASGAFLERLFAASAAEGTPSNPPLPPVDLQVPGMEPTDMPAASALSQSAWSLPWRSLTFVVWLIGLAITLVPITVGLAYNRVLARTAEPILEDKRYRLFSELRRGLGLNRNARLLETDKCLVPMTLGVLRPIVLVPRVWREWSCERQRIVLLHELAHVKRWDTACQLVARLACAVYWLHPLVWYTLRQLRAEREMACDDCVLMAGERPSNYAGHLLAIVRDYRSMATVAVVAMAQSRGLEKRVSAMLDKRRSRLPISPAAGVAVLACSTILLIGVAMAGPNRSDPWEPGTAVSTASVSLPNVEPSATLSGHTSGVWLVGFDDKGRRLVSTGRDGIVKVWNPPRDKERSTWATIDQESESPDRLELHSAALSSDGKTLAVAASSAVITLWDVTSGEKLRALKGHEGAILALAFSPDGKTLISGGIDRILRLWNTETGEPVHEGYGGNSFRIQALVVSPDGEVIISGDRDNVVKLWKMHEKRFISSLPPDGSVLAVACAPNNNGLAAGLDHGRIALWTGARELHSKRQILAGHRGDITAVAFTPDGKILASTGVDGMLKLWDVATGRKMATVHAHLGGARCLAVSADGSQLVTGGDDHEVKIWDVAVLKKAGLPTRVSVPIKEPERSLKVARFEAAISSRIKMLDGVFLAEGSGGSWSPDAGQLAFGTPGGGIAVVDLKTGRRRTLVERGRDPAWSPRANVIAYVRGEAGKEEVCLRDNSKGKTIRLANGLAPTWHPDGTSLFYAGHDETLNAVSWLPGGDVSAPRVIARDVRGRPAVSPDGQHVAYLDRDRLVTIDCQSGQVLDERHVSGDEDASLAWSPDGQQMACAGQKTGLQLFDSTGRPAMRVIRTHVARPVWSPDGRKIAFDVTLAGNTEIWMLETASLASLRAFHTAHHPEEIPAYLDIKPPFEPQGKLVPLDLALQPDPRFPAGALGNPLDDLGNLPRGEQTLAGVTFQIGERPIQLGSEYLPQAPDQVVGIPVHREVARLYVLHAGGYADPYLGNRRSDTIENYVPRPFRSSPFDGVPDGTTIGYYRVRYADGSDEWIAIAEGEDVRDWCKWEGVSLPRGAIAWQTRNELTRVHGNPICLFVGAWENPYPNRKVATIEYISAGTRAAPFCAAITVEEPES